MPKMNGGSNSKDHHTNVINLLNDEYKANTTTVTRVKSSKKRYVNTNASEKLKLSLSKCKKELQLINQSINDYEKKIRPLKLRREQLMNQINTCNNKLNLYNSKGRLTTYNSIQEIMDDFYDVRIEFYER